MHNVRETQFQMALILPAQPNQHHKLTAAHTVHTCCYQMANLHLLLLIPNYSISGIQLIKKTIILFYNGYLWLLNN